MRGRARYEAALRAIVAEGTRPVDSMRGYAGELLRSGQAMVDIAAAALGESVEGAGAAVDGAGSAQATSPASDFARLAEAADEIISALRLGDISTDEAIRAWEAERSTSTTGDVSSPPSSDSPFLAAS